MPVATPHPCVCTILVAGPDVKLAIGVLAMHSWSMCCTTSWAHLGPAIAADERLPDDLVVLLQPLLAGTAAALR